MLSGCHLSEHKVCHNSRKNVLLAVGPRCAWATNVDHGSQIDARVQITCTNIDNATDAQTLTKATRTALPYPVGGAGQHGAVPRTALSHIRW